MSSARRRAALALVIALAAFGVLAGTASAAYRHPGPPEEFGKNGTTEGEPAFSINGGISGLAVDQTRDRLYVNTGDGSIFGYSIPTVTTHTPLGTPWPISTGEGQIYYAAIDVDKASGNFYYMRGSPTSHFFGFNPNGSPLTGYPVQIPGTQCGSAVNSEGLVAETDIEERLVRFFNSSGIVVRTVDVSAVGRPCGVAFDAQNNMYIETLEAGVYKFEAADGYASPVKLEPERAYGMSFDASRGILYVLLSHRVAAYNQAGEELESFAEGTGGSENGGIAVDEATGAIYVSTGHYPSEVAIYPGAIVPDVTTGEPVGNEVVSGHVDPVGGGNITDCEVEYGETTAYGKTVDCSQPTPYTGAKDVTATLTGLEAEQSYHYRIVAGNAKGKNYGADEIITPHHVPALRTNPASELTRTCATLNASFNGNGEETHYFFEYGPTESYGTTSAAPPGTSAGSPSGARAETYRLCMLTPGTTYHYRVVAENPKGKSVANDRTFRTVDAVEQITTEPGTVLNAEAAELHASFQGNGEDTHYYFEYGYNILYGSTTAVPPGVDAGSPTVKTDLAFTLTGLYPGTTYHYRIVASNAIGTSYGEDVSFRTPKLPAVAITGTSDPHELPDGTRAVTLNGTVNPLNGGSTTWHFEYGPTAAYGTSTPEAGPVGTDPNAHPVSAVVTELQPGVNYHYRLVAHNSAGTTYGPDQTYQAVPNAAAIVSAEAAEVGGTSATIRALVRPGNGVTSVLIDYGMSAEYGQTVTVGEPLPADEADHSVSRTLTGLLPNTTYHYRIDAVNFGGVVHGPDQTFSTAGQPIVIGESVTEIGSAAATFHADISPGLLATSYRFEYGTEGHLGAATASGVLGADAVGHAVAVHVGGLTPGTKYQVRVVATNALGATVGGGAQFTTTAAPAKVGPVVCKKGQVKRKGKCVKKPVKKKKHKQKKSGKGKQHGKGKKGGKR